MKIYILNIFILCVFFSLTSYGLDKLEVRNRFGQDFRLESVENIYTKKLLNIKDIKNNYMKDNNTINLLTNLPICGNNIEKNGFLLVKENNDLKLHHIDEAEGSQPIIPDYNFNGSYRPDFTDTAIGISIDN
ncbi:MAG: hypothetical protein SVN78_07160 [Deferribacterota bacterium]|nr:hypothetical protein [Deferribacterota bacterium]